MTSDLTNQRIIITLCIALVFSVYLFFVYRLTVRSVMYARNFNITMSMMSIVTAIVVMAIHSNVILSLGMVGALSIVRFRTAIKDPIDLLFLFWSITIGIVIGAGMFVLALLGILIVSIVLLVLNLIPAGGIAYLLVFNCADEAVLEHCKGLIKLRVKKSLIKSKTVSSKGIELTFEVKLKNSDKDAAFISELQAIDGVLHAAIVSYNGEYMK